MGNPITLIGIGASAGIAIGDLFGARWYPIEAHFGLLPLIGGSLIVTMAYTVAMYASVLAFAGASASIETALSTPMT